MKIKSITLRNFRCFGDCPVTVELDQDITALIGANGSGKTALLSALSRLFGPTQSSRTVRRSDFHVPPGSPVDDRSDLELSIEATLSFPELAGGDAEGNAVAPVFDNLVVGAPGGDLYARWRLEASWTDDGTIEGDVDQNMYWILTAEEPDTDAKKRPVHPSDRGRIQVHYIPANRDPAPELRSAARNRAGRFVRAISWDQGTRDTVQSASETIRETLNNEKAVNVINRLLQERWDELKDDFDSGNAELKFGGSGFEEIINDIAVVFAGDDGSEGDLSGLSEGQQSLFYMALIAAVFDVEREIIALRPTAEPNDTDSSDACPGTEGDDEGEIENPVFRTDKLDLIPDLMVFALEEPENHLSPHYLSRIIGLLRSLTGTGCAQAVFSSHSPSVLRRVLPEEIRHLRLDKDTRTSRLNKIILPESTDEASRFVREAVMAYPELYFGKFVILAEGPSEEIVLPRIASATGLEIDRSFVSVVPLGGRHVNHFWRMLTDLEVPHATLLDLDVGRHSGGWARIKYVCDQLRRIGLDLEELLEFAHEGKKFQITLEELENLHEKPVSDYPELQRWVRHLEKFNVFFSVPLDLDFWMLRQFPEAYKRVGAGSGPRFPSEDSPEWEPYIRGAIGAAVGNNDEGLTLYSNLPDTWKELFPWYRYLFVSRGKPATHIQGLTDVPREELKKNAPATYIRLLNLCEGSIAP